MGLWKLFDQGLQQRKSVFNLPEVKMPFSAMSPPPAGSDDANLANSDLRFGVEHQWQTRAARKMLVEVKAVESPRTTYHVLECSWGSCVSANKQMEEGLGICCTCCAPTHWIYCTLASNCQYLSTWSAMVSTSQEIPKHPGDMLAVDKVKRLCKSSRHLNQGPPGTDAVFLCCTLWQGMVFFSECDPLIHNTLRPPST